MNGAAGPQPLRSKEHPLGLPWLQPESTDANRVRVANCLYAFSYRVLLACVQRGIVVSLENPVNSFVWDVLRSFEPSNPADQLLPKLSEIFFDLCCHGGSRPKRTKLLATSACFDALHALCPGNHPHKPWGQIVECGSVRYATKDEAAYPALFSQRYAACLARRALAAGLALTRRPTTKDLSLAMLGRPSKRHRPLVSEYSSVLCIPASQFKAQKHLKLLRSGIGGCEVRASSSSRPSKHLLPPGNCEVRASSSSRPSKHLLPPGSALQPGSTPLGGPIPEAPSTELASKHLLPPGSTPLGGPIPEAPGSHET